MKTLPECADEEARKVGYQSFDDLVSSVGNYTLIELKGTQYDLVLERAAKRFASQFREPSSPDKIDEAISYFEEIKSERESKKEDDTVLINYVLIILKSIKQRSPTVKESETGEQEDDFVLGLAKWLIENRRSVFIEADISHSRKKAILYKLGYSSDIIE